ncbi:MAG: PIN domain-containing protein [Candidatus Njordarchaeales archaeon]
MAYIITNDPNHEVARRLIEEYIGSTYYISELSIAEMTSVLSRNIERIRIEEIRLEDFSLSNKTRVLYFTV